MPKLPLSLLVLCLCVCTVDAGFFSKLASGVTGSLKKIESAETLAAKSFSHFKAKYGKVYASEEEHARRKLIFKENLEVIAKLNAEHGPDATFGPTKFADLTTKEFKEHIRCRDNRTMLEAEDYYPDTENLPDSVDWVPKGAVTPVKDQGQCGSCWAFGTTGVVEGAWFLAGNPLVSLSEQELVSCDQTDDGCNGGLQSDALKFIKKKGGIVSEKTYPYTSGGGNTGSCKKAKETGPIAAKISSWKNVLPHTATALKAAVSKQPVTIAVNAGTDLFQFYNSGIMKASKRKCDPSDLDHAVLSVGYGTSGSTDFWKVKNSWASDWGENGYFRIERGSNTCGCESDAQIATA